MLSYLLRRLLTGAAVFLLISVGVFLLVRAAPGDPVLMMVDPEQLAAGGPAFLAAKRAELGLDQPLPVTYGIWLRDALGGDLGYSFVSRRPVAEVLGERMGPTVLLMGTALAIGLVLAVAAGTVAATRRNTAIDYATTVASLGTVSVPSFFLGIATIYLFSLKLGWTPSSGMSTPGGGGAADVSAHLVLPAAVLGLSIAGPFTRYVRAGLLAELGADYVRTAEAKGAGPARVLVRHALRNALVPLVTVVMISVPQLLAGAVALEQVFSWPGMGQLAVSSVGMLDYPVVIGFAMFVALLVLVCNLAADLLYAAADPRISLS
ncbi:peptide/nickel transport system permease protein [Nonomuraea maritima]|uniref:Peptide/nickel transport system permease protein n=1 Tax=Nonomuraea maritima TaxID=683260 RepID=A0A1G9BCN8_9ACTN|nr:ABC transporter permease [Nonomuraea maritima]SDK37253.1 peptide/nickel transport system permease protein [Nonomuraea maritima]